MKHQPNGVSIGAIRTTNPAYTEILTCPDCGIKFAKVEGHQCADETAKTFEYYSPVAKLAPLKPPKRVKEGGC